MWKENSAVCDIACKSRQVHKYSTEQRGNGNAESCGERKRRRFGSIAIYAIKELMR